ncbi:heavy-metal-associated domain-containing protein [Fusibacter sp. JL216-2]|uniref:heavy-metal-associated domain-containing protein n=1 Tax=Fusibacter sp. JL216-2 TaxID=3071453 RepID=UPI003D32A178
MKKTVFIEGMSCNHCKMRVENTLGELEGVANASVNLEAKQAVVDVKAEVSNESITQAIDDIGFEVVRIEG